MNILVRTVWDKLIIQRKKVDILSILSLAAFIWYGRAYILRSSYLNLSIVIKCTHSKFDQYRTVC